MKEFFPVSFLRKIAVFAVLIFAGILLSIWLWQVRFLKLAQKPVIGPQSPRAEVEFESGDLRRSFQSLHSGPSASDLNQAYEILLSKKNLKAIDGMFRTGGRR